MKIQARNAYSFVNHTKVLGYLSGKYSPDELKDMAYCCEGEDVYAALMRIEGKAHRLAERECNGEIEEKESERLSEQYENQVKELLPRLFVPGRHQFILNGDPRGYSLKGSEQFVKELSGILGINPYTDFGGYFILAPEF